MSRRPPDITRILFTTIFVCALKVELDSGIQAIE